MISANLGGYDVPNVWPEQVLPAGVSLEVRRFTDANLPPRPLAMTSRLQCGIPKWFGADFATAEVLIWIDASCAPTPTAVSWFLAQLGGADIAVFKHPERATIAEEYAFIKTRMRRPGETYLTSRYAGEWLDAQYEHIPVPDRSLPLYASTAFAYRPYPRVLAALAEVFLMKARYLLHDQLAFPYALAKHACFVRMIPENYLKCDALTFTRKKAA